VLWCSCQSQRDNEVTWFAPNVPHLRGQALHAEGLSVLQRAFPEQHAHESLHQVRPFSIFLLLLLLLAVLPCSAHVVWRWVVNAANKCQGAEEQTSKPTSRFVTENYRSTDAMILLMKCDESAHMTDKLVSWRHVLTASLVCDKQALASRLAGWRTAFAAVCWRCPR